MEIAVHEYAGMVWARTTEKENKITRLTLSDEGARESRTTEKEKK